MICFSICVSSAQSPSLRNWTSAEGKSIQAEYLGVKGDSVALRLQDGKVSFVPLARLSPSDNAFVAKNKLPYLARWNGWPAEAGMMLKYPDVTEEKKNKDSTVYTTPKFRFHCDVNLGATLMNDLARIFELTYHLNENSPFGVLAKPDQDRFEAKLMASLATYRAQGGPANSAGCYLMKEKIFLAPLELMGMKSTSMGWRKVTDDYDPSTIIHELTHMLTHDMLENLPLWINEGYAEYISNIPLQNKAFQTSTEKIRQGMQDTFVRDHARQSDRSFGEITTAERRDILRSGSFMKLPKVASMLDITDQNWQQGLSRSNPNGRLPGFSNFPHRTSHLPSYYRTAHLIIYYFIQIEGDAGVVKLRRNLEANRARLAEYHKFVADFARYEAEWKAFSEKPGVRKLPDGSIEYPENLTPPTAPKAPFEDPNVVRYGGLSALLDGKSKEELGAQIEAALIKDLGMKLTFE